MKNTLYYRLDMKEIERKDEAGKPAKLTVL